MAIDSEGASPFAVIIALLVLAFAINHFRMDAQMRILKSSDWKVAYHLRRVMYRTALCFAFLATIILGVVVQDFKKKIRTDDFFIWLFAVMIVVHAFVSEPLRMADLEALQRNVINKKRIRELDGNRKINTSLKSNVAKWVQQLKLACLETTFSFPGSENEPGGIEDLIQVLERPPLCFSSHDSDYAPLAIMLRHDPWKIVCACETSYNEFYALLRCVRGTKWIDTSSAATDELLLYSKLLALLEQGKYQNYYDDLRALKNQLQMAGRVPSDADVISEWLQKDSFDKLREPCRVNLEKMMKVCPVESVYWMVLKKMVEWKGSKKFPEEFKTLEAPYLLYTLQVDASHSVNDMVTARNAFIEDCIRHVNQLVSEMKSEEAYALFYSQNAVSLAEVAVLTYLRVQLPANHWFRMHAANRGGGESSKGETV